MQLWTPKRQHAPGIVHHPNKFRGVTTAREFVVEVVTCPNTGTTQARTLLRRVTQNDAPDTIVSPCPAI
jgi:hypothetical protein